MGKLTIEHENLAAWMTINNTFVEYSKWDKEVHYWNGVMIQLGNFTDHQDKSLVPAFKTITLDGAKKIVLSREDFEKHTIWINLIPEDLGEVPDRQDKAISQRALPMHSGDWRRLFPDKEGRSIHQHLKPFAGGITIWPKRNLTVVIEPRKVSDNSDEYVNRTHTFEWSESMRAQVFQDGSDGPIHDIPGIVAVTIVGAEKDGLPDGIHQDPPQR